MTDVTTTALDEIMPVVRRLPTYDKLVLIRFIVEELTHDKNLLSLLPHQVYDSYTPYAIDGITDGLIDKLESAPPPIVASNAS
jgi:hypothetical protein